MKRRFMLWGAVCLCATLTASADPVPVIPHGVRDAAPTAEQAERVARGAGAEALVGAPLRDALLRSFGRFAPREDVLAAQRAAVSSGWTAYFRSGPRAARRALAEAVTAMEAAPDALALREDNRAAYLRAVGMLARIELESRHTEEAETWARKALRLSAAWAPSSEDFPPPVHQLVARLRSADGASGAGRLTVRLPREGCGVTVDGEAIPGTARERSRPVPAGTHRVWASCDAPSRVREVTVRAGETLAIAIDPELDGRLQLSGAASLVYASAQDQSSLLAADAAALGRALGASTVLTVGAQRVRAVDVARAQSRGELDPAAPDFAAALTALREGRAAPASASVATPSTPHPEAPRSAGGPGAGPWALVIAGGAVAASGVVFWVLRGAAYDDLSQRCPFADGAPSCADADSQRLATEDRDRANLWQGAAIGAWAAGGVALTSGLLWYALGGRRAERVSVSASHRGASLTVRW